MPLLAVQDIVVPDLLTKWLAVFQSVPNPTEISTELNPLISASVVLLLASAATSFEYRNRVMLSVVSNSTFPEESNTLSP